MNDSDVRKINENLAIMVANHEKLQNAAVDHVIAIHTAILAMAVALEENNALDRGRVADILDNVAADQPNLQAAIKQIADKLRLRADDLRWRPEVIPGGKTDEEPS